LQSRAVEFAKNYGVKLEVMSSFVEKPGTIVTAEVKDMEDIVVRGIAADKAQVKVTMQGIADRPGIAAIVFKELAAGKVNVDMIVQNVGEKGHADISFTVPRGDLVKARKMVDKLSGKLQPRCISVDEDIAKISIVGVGMKSHSGVAYRMFETLAKHKINIGMIATSEIKISVVIGKDKADDAVRALHAAFDLGRKAKRTRK
jgi:aspartate kinase